MSIFFLNHYLSQNALVPGTTPSIPVNFGLRNVYTITSVKATFDESGVCALHGAPPTCVISLCDSKAEDGVYQGPPPARLSDSEPTHLTKSLYCL